MPNNNSILSALNLYDYNPGAYIGDWFNDESINVLTSCNPATLEDLAKVNCASTLDYHQVVNDLKAASPRWINTPAPKRGEIIRQIGIELRNHKDNLGSLIAMEMGKSKQEGDGEVQEMIDIADFAVGQSRMLYGKTMHSERLLHRMYEQWHPYGIVGVITAFNFPMAVWGWNAFIAAVCGNVVLWKPSSKTPLCSIAVHKICAKILKKNNCPNIFGLIIPGDQKINDLLVEDKSIPLISFTGSTKVGRSVAQKVAARLGKTILELGGNNAIIIDETADLNLAIPAVLFGAIGTAGQRCTSTRRLFLPNSLYETVLSQLTAAYGQIRIGDPLNINNHMGPLIDGPAVLQFDTAVDIIKQKGGVINFGGKVIDKPGYFVEPTLVSNVANDWDIVQTETFAPILYVMPFNDLNHAISMQNDVPQGLSSALFTQNLKNAELYLSAMGSDCGIANINIGTSGAEIGGAFGGEKETGGGRESGSDTWKFYMRRQTNTINWGDSLPLAQGIKFNLGKNEEKYPI